MNSLVGLELYLQHTAAMDTGDLVEWSSDNLIGRMIRLFTRRDTNHTSLLIRPKNYLGLKDRRFMIEALESGPTATLLSARFKDYEGKVYWIPLKPDFNHRRDSIGTWAILEMIERRPRYDYGSILKHIFGRVSLDGQRYFCSEFAHAAWINGGVIGPPADGKAARPGDFEDFGVTLQRVKIFDSKV
jgi:hypothetical protein